MVTFFLNFGSVCNQGSQFLFSHIQPALRLILRWATHPAHPPLCRAPHGVGAVNRRGLGRKGLVLHFTPPASPQPCPAQKPWEGGTHPARLSSGHCRTPGGCQVLVPGRQRRSPGSRQSGCSHLCSRVWRGQGGEPRPLAPPQVLCLLGRQGVDSYGLVHKLQPP